MSALNRALRMLAAILAGGYVSLMMMGGGVYWIIYVVGVGAGQSEHLVRGCILIGLSLVGLFFGSVVGLRVWKFRLD